MTGSILEVFFRLILFERGDFHTIRSYFDGEHNFARDTERIEKWLKRLGKHTRKQNASLLNFSSHYKANANITEPEGKGVCSPSA